MSELFRTLAFKAREALRWSPPATVRALARSAFRARLQPGAQRRFDGLSHRHALEPWSALCNSIAWHESAYVLDVVSQWLPPQLPEGRCLDVGSKNGSYIPGLVTAVPRGWDFVELDAHRRYLWGATRRAYGERMASAFAGCVFHAADVKTLEGPWAFVTWFLPFLTPAPVDAWGLPATVLEPQRLLAHVISRVKPGGALLIVNQGDDEAAIQRRLLGELAPRVLIEKTGVVESPLSPFLKRRLGTLIRAPNANGLILFLFFIDTCQS